MPGKVRNVTAVQPHQVQQMIAAERQSAAQLRALTEAANKAAAARRRLLAASPDVRDGRRAVPPFGSYGKG